MKQTFKLCWFCEKKCYSFVSICTDCFKEKRKSQHIFFKTNIIKQQEKDGIRNSNKIQLK